MAIVPFQYNLYDPLDSTERKNLIKFIVANSTKKSLLAQVEPLLRMVTVDCTIDTETGAIAILKIIPQPDEQFHEAGMNLALDPDTGTMRVAAISDERLDFNKREHYFSTEQRQAISEWFDWYQKQGATHMVIVYDTYYAVKYPVPVIPGQDAREVATWHDARQSLKSPLSRDLRALWTYDLTQDKEAELNASERVFHLNH